MFAFSSVDGILLEIGREKSMDYYSMTDVGILRELGSRIRDKRLNSNITQNSLAAKAGVYLKVIQNIEYGKTATITGFLRVLRALKSLDYLDDFIPKTGLLSPLEIMKFQRRRRQRASRVVKTDGA